MTNHEEPHIRPGAQECISCRVVGTGAFAGTGAYAIWLSRAAAPGTPGQKKILAGLGIALLVGGVFRWRNEPLVWRSTRT